MGETDVNELMKAAENWGSTTDGRKFANSVESQSRRAEDEWKQFENSPEAQKAMGEAMKEFSNLEKMVGSAMSSPEGKAAIQQF